MKFYRKNNKYYFESDSLEGKIVFYEGEVTNVVVENGEISEQEKGALIIYLNCHLLAIKSAESVL